MAPGADHDCALRQHETLRLQGGARAGQQWFNCARIAAGCRIPAATVRRAKTHRTMAGSCSANPIRIRRSILPAMQNWGGRRGLRGRREIAELGSDGSRLPRRWCELHRAPGRGLGNPARRGRDPGGDEGWGGRAGPRPENVLGGDRRRRRRIGRRIAGGRRNARRMGFLHGRARPPRACGIRSARRARGRLELGSRGDELASRSDELFEEGLADAVEAGDFRRFGRRSRGRLRLDVGAYGSELAASRDEVPELVGADTVEARSFGTRRLCLAAGLCELLREIRANPFDAGDLLAAAARRHCERQPPDSEAEQSARGHPPEGKGFLAGR